MRKLLNFNCYFRKLKEDVNTIFIIFVLVGLPTATLLNEYLYIFIDKTLINFVSFFRILIILFTIILCLINKKKFNKYIFLLLILNAIFFLNQTFQNTISYDLNVINYYIKKEVIIDPYGKLFFLEKEKSLIINFFNIIIILLVLSFKNYKINEKRLNNYLPKILKTLFYLLVFLLFLKPIYEFDLELLKLNVFSGSSYFFNTNPHLIGFIISLYIISLFRKYMLVNKEKFIIPEIILAYFILFISGLNLHLFTCIVVKIIFFLFYYFFKKKNPFELGVIIILLLILIIFIQTSYKNIYDSGILGSLYNRFVTIELYVMHINNFNYFIGNNIFSIKNYYYPHNFFLDIYLCTGVIGLIIILFLIIKIFSKIKNIFTIKLLNLFFFYNIIFHLFSGFYFTNISLNILFALFLIDKGDKDV